MPLFNALVQGEPNIQECDRGCLCLTHSFGVNPTFRSVKFGVSKLETSFYRSEKYFNISNRLGVDHDCDTWLDRRIDERTDRHSDSKCRA